MFLFDILYLILLLLSCRVKQSWRALQHLYRGLYTGQPRAVGYSLMHKGFVVRFVLWRLCMRQRARSIGWELAPLTATSSTNAFTRVYINVIAVGSNSFFSHPRARLSLPTEENDVTGSLRVELSSATARTISHRALSYLPTRGPSARTYDLNTRACFRHVYRPTPTSNARTRTRCRTPSAREGGQTHGIEAAGPRGTRFTDPSCKRRYRYLYRPISARRLIGSAREYLGPAWDHVKRPSVHVPPVTGWSGLLNNAEYENCQNQPDTQPLSLPLFLSFDKKRKRFILLFIVELECFSSFSYTLFYFVRNDKLKIFNSR